MSYHSNNSRFVLITGLINLLIIKPILYIYNKLKPVKMKKIIIVLIAATTLATACKEKPSTASASATKPEVKEVKEVWEYKTDEDQMTSKKQFYATATSTNKVVFDFPYKVDGGSTFYLIVRDMGNGNEIAVSVDKGQFLGSYSGSKSVRVKFDDEQPIEVSYGGASDGSANVIFLSEEKKLLAKMKTAKKLRIEAPFYKAGNQIMEFDVQGLKWEH
jgi:hypothetical protein